MKKVSLALVFAIVIIINFVSAIETPITIKTLPNHDIFISVAEPTESYFQLIEMFKVFSGDKGNQTVIFSKDQYDEVRVIVIVKDFDGNNVFRNSEIYEIGKPITIRLLPDYWIDENNNETPDGNITREGTNATNSTREIENNTSTITGRTISNSNEKSIFDINKKTIFIIIGVVFILVALLLLTTRFAAIFRRDPAYNYKPIKPDMKEIKPDATFKNQNMDFDSELSAAEIKIKEAEETINKIKNRKKIEEIEKRMEEEKALLEKLKGKS